MNIVHIKKASHSFRRISLFAVFGLAILFIRSESALAQWATNGNNINNTNTGNVGIATGSPGTTLDVSGNILTLGSDVAATTRTNNTTKLNRLAMPAFTSSNLMFSVIAGATTSTDNIVGVGGAAGGLAASTLIVFHTAANTNTDTGTERMRINSAGNIGIGTTSPRGLLDVAGDGKVLTVGVNGTYGAGLVLSGSAGTAILSNNAFITAGAASFSNVDTSKSSAIIEFANQDTYFRRIGSGSLPAHNESMFIQGSSGNVGIATLTPSEKLHVVGNGKFTGNLTVDGNIAAKYQDVAEWVPATRVLPPGTVVTLNPTKSNLVEASSKAYDTRVAGVISAQPGIALGERGENKVLVATTGRVRIKVNASRGSIEIGDLLVTSEKEGVAMKSVPISVGGVEIHRPGTLIGKALEPLAKGTGEILVLLSLQ